MSNTYKPQLVELAHPGVISRYRKIAPRPATISLGGFYWTSHTPTSAADVEFINKTVQQLCNTQGEKDNGTDERD